MKLSILALCALAALSLSSSFATARVRTRTPPAEQEDLATQYWNQRFAVGYSIQGCQQQPQTCEEALGQTQLQADEILRAQIDTSTVYFKLKTGEIVQVHIPGLPAGA